MYIFLNDFMVYDQNQNWHVIFFNLNFHPHLIILEIDQCNLNQTLFPLSCKLLNM